ncbi:MAG: type 1 glutamine amidotransferase [Actinobacteria bacterium]|nr:MAG: type 1 glutamine amidotransferase [Actinomycetota bacterium]
MNIHYLQHVPYEDLGNIAVWAENRGNSISRTRLFKNESLPATKDFDWLIIMGGPMSIYEGDKYPWLNREKEFIKKAIHQNKLVLGICLGAQLIADVLGARIYKNKYKEIGWFQVNLTQEAMKSPNFSSLPNTINAFHWHGDTFDLPQGAIRMAESEGCKNQAFEYNKRVIGLQFHLESTIGGIKKLVQNCSNEVSEGKYVHKADEMLARDDYFNEASRYLNLLLDNISF